jgi:hypothetical protein
MSQQNNKWDQTHSSSRRVFTSELQALGFNETDLPMARQIFERLTSQQVIAKLESVLEEGFAVNGTISAKQRATIEGFVDRVKESK